MKKVYERTKIIRDLPFHYCPGCGHGIATRLVAEVIDELGIENTAVGVAPIGCSSYIFKYLDIDMIEAAHGRAIAVATGIKRVNPNAIVFTYQGDGDFAAIGTEESIHVALRKELITTIFINNTLYAMTGGQLAPTTLVGQKTTTSKNGRSIELQGYPFKATEFIASFDGTAYAARGSLHSPAHIARCKKYIKRAFQAQLNGLGYGLVEVLSMCPVNWHLDPINSLKWIEERVIPFYPEGEFKKGFQESLLRNT